MPLAPYRPSESEKVLELRSILSLKGSFPPLPDPLECGGMLQAPGHEPRIVHLAAKQCTDALFFTILCKCGDCLRGLDITLYYHRSTLIADLYCLRVQFERIDLERARFGHLQRSELEQRG